MYNPWKVATLALLAVGVVAGTSSLTTAYLMRPPAAPATARAERIRAEGVEAPRAPIVRVAPASAKRVARPAPRPVSVAGVPPAVSEPVVERASVSSPPITSAPPAVSAPAPVTAPADNAPAVSSAPSPVAAATPSAAPAADCATGGDRALRIAKPGALGALLGAGLGAAGGAIADGGKGAGKGALIGGITGAVAGTGYGAYRTRQDCGTVFGDSAR